MNKSVGLSEIQSPDPVWSNVITGNPCHMFFFPVSFQLSTVTIQAFKWEKTKKKKLNQPNLTQNYTWHVWLCLLPTHAIKQLLYRHNPDRRYTEAWSFPAADAVSIW